MKRFVLALTAVLLLSQSAQAWVLPDQGRAYFTGSTLELEKIRAGINKIAGFPEASWSVPLAPGHGGVLSPPMGLGEVDCLDASYRPNQGPYDGAEDYLGMSTMVKVNGELVGVEIPTLGELVTQADWPGECYGYTFYQICVETGFGDMFCPDPVP